MISWLFLGIGIGLGCVWAYVVLGWGGYLGLGRRRKTPAFAFVVPGARACAQLHRVSQAWRV